MEKVYYVYVLTDPRTNQPFYVGKGTGWRVNQHFSYAKQIKDGEYVHHDPVYKKIRDITASGFNPAADKVLQDATEQEALVIEKKLISQYGRLIDGSGILTNRHPGGVHPNGRTCKPVDQFCMDGELIASHESAKAAGDLIGVAAQYIGQVCKGRRVSAGGYLWAYKGEQPIRTNKQYWRAVQQFKDGELVAEYKSLTEAENITGIEKHNISEACRGKSKTAGGYIWRYVNTLSGDKYDTERDF